MEFRAPSRSLSQQLRARLHDVASSPAQQCSLARNCWDNDVLVALNTTDPPDWMSSGLTTCQTSKAAFWGSDAVTVKAAMELHSGSECFKYFTPAHTERCLKVIEGLKREREYAWCADACMHFPVCISEGVAVLCYAVTVEVQTLSGVLDSSCERASSP